MRWLAVVGLLVSVGCDNKSSLPDITSLVTITSGVYGQTGSVCDTGLTCHGVTALVNQPVGIFSALPWQGGGADLAFARTDSRGLFQFELGDGMYFVCSGYGENGNVTYTSCTDALVENSDRVRRTMIFGSGSETWTGGTTTYYPGGG